MSGRIVPMIGGPLDGREAHRSLSTGGSRDERTYYTTGGTCQSPSAEVHVYASQGSKNAPFRYEGIRPRRDGDESWPMNLESRP